jgi:hypothetical protein
VDTFELDNTVREQMEKMAQVHAGKHHDVDVNPFITFVVKDIEN